MKSQLPAALEPSLGPIATGLGEIFMFTVDRAQDARAADGTFAPAFLDDLRSPLHEVGFLQLTDFGAAPGQIAELTEGGRNIEDLAASFPALLLSFCTLALSFGPKDCRIFPSVGVKAS